MVEGTAEIRTFADYLYHLGGEVTAGDVDGDECRRMDVLDGRSSWRPSDLPKLGMAETRLGAESALIISVCLR
jgi:hypothetical protein